MHISLNEIGSMVLLVDPESIEAVFLDSGAQPDDLFRIEKASVEIFSDGFETGDASGWSGTAP